MTAFPMNSNLPPFQPHAALCTYSNHSSNRLLFIFPYCCRLPPPTSSAACACFRLSCLDLMKTMRISHQRSAEMRNQWNSLTALLLRSPVCLPKMGAISPHRISKTCRNHMPSKLQVSDLLHLQWWLADYSRQVLSEYPLLLLHPSEWENVGCLLILPNATFFWLTVQH